jgi:LuxR family maltose regulon positive regulatory protein
MIVVVGHVEEPDPAAAPVDRREAGGILPRPGLFRRLRGARRVVLVTAPAGSGKSALLRSWVGEPEMAGQAAWVSVGRDERDPQGFWLSVVRALRATVAGRGLVGELSAAPGLDGWTVVEGLLADLAALEGRLWLVADDVHELGPEALRQLGLLVMRAPRGLRFALAARHDVRLGLHRLRLEGELMEVRADDLRFTVVEAGQMLAAAGVELPHSAVAALHARTEGWAAGLRLAALSLAGHPDPARFAREFSGTERTVAEYLLAEVLDRQSEAVRRLLLRTSILERVNGELADLLAGGCGGERVLQDLEEAGAFTWSLNAARSWFRYHPLFADLLRLELRRAEPAEVNRLHQTASAWLASHGHPAEAIRHAQATSDWKHASQMLTSAWPGLYLDGQSEIIHELLTGFPSEARVADAGLAAVAAADELAQGSLEAAEQYLGLAEQAMASVPETRRERVHLLLGVVRLLAARQRGNLPAAIEEAGHLQVMAEAPAAMRPGLGEDLRALALTSLGITEYWAASTEDAERHLEGGIALADRAGRPILTFRGMAHQSAIYLIRSSWARAAERSMQVIELAQRHGWTSEEAAGVAYGTYAATLAWRGRPAEAEPWLQRAERIVRSEAEPVSGIGIHYVRGVLELGRGQDADAAAALQAAEQLAKRLAAPHYLTVPARALLVHALLRLGETEQAEHVLARLGDHDRDRGETCLALAGLRLAFNDPLTATVALAPVLDGSAPLVRQTWSVAAYVLEALARDALVDPAAADSAIERALDLAEPEGALWYFLLFPAPALLERHARHITAHASLITEILSLLAVRSLAPQPGPQPPREPLSESEIRVLRYLPTNLSGPEVAQQLHISQNTVKTHIRNIYLKLHTHSRTDAVQRARALGMLAPSVTLPSAAATRSPRPLR